MSVQKTNKNLENYLRELLFNGVVNTQVALCDHLQKQGYDANQSKVSRLLRKIGAVKIKNKQGELIYSLPKEPDPLTQFSALAPLITQFSHNETTIIINTMPGAANYVARSLDYQQDELKILGTIAGDDTIFIIPTSIKTLSETLDNIKLFFDK